MPYEGPDENDHEITYTIATWDFSMHTDKFTPPRLNVQWNIVRLQITNEVSAHMLTDNRAFC